MTAHCGLLALYNELMFQILGDLHAQDLVNFALVNKDILSLSRSFLEEHRSLQRQYSIVTHDGSQFAQPAKFIKEIDSRKSIIEYVRILRIQGWHDGWPEEDPLPGSFESLDEALASAKNICMKHCKETGCYNANYLSEMQEKIRLGNEEYLLAFMLLILPNLQTLKLEVSIEDSGAFLSTFDLIKEGQIEALQKLQNVELIQHDEGAHSAIEILGRILQLPATRTLRISGITEWFEKEDLPIIETSNITCLTICDSNLSGYSMDAFLYGMSLLKSFSFRYTQRGTIYLFRPWDIRVALETAAKDTLESFEMLGCHVQGALDNDCRDDSTVYPLGSLRKFTKLKSVSTNIEMVYMMDRMRENPEERKISHGSTLLNRLPTSIQTLKAHINQGNLEVSVFEDLEAALYNLDPGFPELKNLTVVVPFRNSRALDVKKTAEEVMRERGGKTTWFIDAQLRRGYHSQTFTQVHTESSDISDTDW